MENNNSSQTPPQKPSPTEQAPERVEGMRSPAYLAAQNHQRMMRRFTDKSN